MDAYSIREWAPDDYAHREAALRTPEEDATLLNGLLHGVKAKRKLNADLLADGDWDLFLTVFGESHAVGHQQWHLHDPAHPRFHPDSVRMVGGDPIVQIYSALDAALGETLSLVSRDATVLVLLSHGMGPTTTAPTCSTRCSVDLICSTGLLQAAAAQNKCSSAPPLRSRGTSNATSPPLPRRQSADGSWAKHFVLVRNLPSRKIALGSVISWSPTTLYMAASA
jgi:hypothetical protein